VSGGIPYLTFESADCPVGEGRARWQAMIGAYDVTLPEGQEETDFAVTSESWLVGELLISHGHLTPVELRRSAERVVADGRDTFTFGLVTRGVLAGDFDGRACELRPGQVCVIDFSRPWRARTASTEFILVSAPRAPLVAAAPHARNLHGRLLEGATGRLLIEHFTALVRHLPQARAEDAPVIQSATLRMIAASLEALEPGDGEPRRAEDRRLIDRVRRHIEERLDAEDLSPESLSRALGVSRPTLYRAFAGTGGVMGYIRRRRLETVHVLLSDRAETRSLAELALAFGFSSHAHFSTAFRRRFGYAPRDARLGAVPPGVATQLFHSWMLTLAGPAAPSEGLAKAR
jgi:AraC-like DNA-binding protein